MIQADVGSKCLDCVRRDRPSARTRVTYWNAAQPLLVTKVLIAINAVVFVLTNVGGINLGGGGELSENTINLGLYKGFLYNDEWYRLVTAGFVHFGLRHSSREAPVRSSHHRGRCRAGRRVPSSASWVSRSSACASAASTRSRRASG